MPEPMTEQQHKLQWKLSGATWALTCPDLAKIFDLVRWSDIADQYLDLRGHDLGTDLEKAQRKVEEKYPCLSR